MLCLVVRTLSAQTCVFISRVFAAGHTDSYNIRETETKQRLSGKFCTYEQRIILMGFSVLERAFIWGRFQRLSPLQKLSFPKVDTRQGLRNYFLRVLHLIEL